MPTIYMLRNPGTKEFPSLAHLREGFVYDGVAKDDANALIKANLAEEFNEDNSIHAASIEEHERQDAKKAVPVVRATAAAPKLTVDYDAKHVDELHAEAAKRNIEGRSALTTKADLIKALEKDDKSRAKK